MVLRGARPTGRTGAGGQPPVGEPRPARARADRRGRRAGRHRARPRLGVHKATASRLVATLAERGLVERDPVTEKYRLGFGLIRLAGAAMAGLDLVRTARPILEDLAERTRETVNLGVLSGDARRLRRPGRRHALDRGGELGRAPHAAALPRRTARSCWRSCDDAERERLPRRAARARHARHDHRPGGAPRAAGRDPPRAGTRRRWRSWRRV